MQLRGAFLNFEQTKHFNERTNRRVASRCVGANNGNREICGPPLYRIYFPGEKKRIVPLKPEKQKE